MTKAKEALITPTAPRKPDGIITTQIKNQILIIDLFFNHDSTETFQDKLIKIILAEKQLDF